MSGSGARDLDVDQDGCMGTPLCRGREARLLVEVGVGGEAHVGTGGCDHGEDQKLVEVSGAINKCQTAKDALGGRAVYSEVFVTELITCYVKLQSGVIDVVELNKVDLVLKGR